MRFSFKILLPLYFVVSALSAAAQIGFTNETRQYKKQLPTRSVMPGAVVDMDGDLTDDLVILDKGRVLKWVKSDGMHFGLTLQDTMIITNAREWSMTAGDLNNDGIPEILTAGEAGPVQIVSVKDGSLSKSSVQSGVYAQASNTIDINNDGWLDYFVCNDRGHSRIYINDKSGKLVPTQVIDFSENDPTDGSGNYGSEWIDINGDRLPDLYISKCRAGVNDASDPRRINRLYINMGNGRFENQSRIFGMDWGTQTWVTAFGDLDNDGDPDAFMINHYAPHTLFENVEGRFFREVPLPEVMNSFGFQAVIRDLDNDGLQDILMTGVEGSLALHNKGSWKFGMVREPLGPGKVLSFSMGDLNDDGFLDVHAHVGKPINEPGVKDDELWLNAGNQNHYVAFVLQGKKSNASGIGSLITVYTEQGKQVRCVKGGESYGIFNSFKQHFGLGKTTLIDSVSVEWPSGIRDVYSKLASGNTYLIQEGLCMTPHTALYPEAQIYANTPVTLKALPGYTSYTWNNGQKTINTDVAPGTYHVTMTDAQGCKTISKPVKVVSGCFTASISLLNEDASLKLCDGENIKLQAAPAASYIWNDGQNGSSIQVNEPGLYTVRATDYCGTTLYDTVQVVIVRPEWQVTGDTVQEGQRAMLISDRPDTRWYLRAADAAPFYTGDTLITEILKEPATYYTSVSEILQSRDRRTGELSFPQTNEYGANTTSGGLIFKVDNDCMLHAVRVKTDISGERRITIRDIDGRTVFAKTYYLEAGENRLVLDAVLSPSTRYTIATDEGTNELNFGHKGPRLVRTFNNTRYPYEIENVLTILSSTLGAVYYYYFYDWEVVFDIRECGGEKKEVIAWVTKTSHSDEISADKAIQIGIAPNPSSGEAVVTAGTDIRMIRVLNAQGMECLKFRNAGVSATLSALLPGVYVIEVTLDSGVHLRKFIVE
jgi:hypothetical protein